MGPITDRIYRHPKEKRTTGVLVVLVLLSSLFNISLVVLMVTKRSDDIPHAELFTSTDTKEEGDLCVSCGSGVYEDGERRGTSSGHVEVVKVDGYRTMCCLRHAEGLMHLIKLFQGINQLEKEVNVSNPNTTIEYSVARPSAHLFLNQKDFKGDAMTWSLDPGYHTAHVTGNIKCVNNNIYIQEVGVYNVYTFATFVSRDTSSDNTPKYITHSIRRKNIQNSDRPEILFSRPTLIPNTHGKVSSCLEDNIKLEFGDVLSVHLSNYSNLYNHSLSSYFGIYQL